MSEKVIGNNVDQIAEAMDDAAINPENYTTVVGDVNAPAISKEELLAKVMAKREKEIPSNVATQELQVPSQGYFGGPSKVTIRRMTTKEEKIMFTATDANFLSEIVKSCIVSHDIDFHQFHENDLTYLLYAIRNFTFGNTYNQIQSCPFCGIKNNFIVDITKMPLKMLDIDMVNKEKHVSLVDAEGDVLTLNILTEGDLRDISNDVESAVLSGRTKDQAGYSFDLRLSRIIGDLNGKPFENEFIKKDYLENLSSKDYNKLSKVAGKIASSFGITRLMNVVCKGCKRSMEVEAIVAPEFFRPDEEI